jgi:hypothetical protein
VGAALAMSSQHFFRDRGVHQRRSCGCLDTIRDRLRWRGYARDEQGHHQKDVKRNAGKLARRDMGKF